MNIYFADRYMNILGMASTGQKEGMVIRRDVNINEVDTGVASLEFNLLYPKGKQKEAEKWADAGNYILQERDGISKLYTIIDCESDTKTGEIYVYAEDAGMDLLNEVVGPFAADRLHPIEYYVKIFTRTSGFVIGVNEISDLIRQLEWSSNGTAMERLRDVAQEFNNAEISFSFQVKGLKVTRKIINIYRKRGQDIGIELRLDRDIDRIITKKSVADIATALIPTGGRPEGENDPITLQGFSFDDGDFHVVGDRLMSRQGLSRWSRFLGTATDATHITGHIEQKFSYDTLSQGELCHKAIDHLKRIREVAINFEVDISVLPDGVRIGDRVSIVDREGELYLSARVLKLEISASDNTATAILGEFLIRESGISQRLEELASQFEELANRRQFFTWIAYADDEAGNGISLNPAGKPYLGITSNRTVEEVDISDPTIFRWSRIKGTDAIPPIVLNLRNEVQNIPATINGAVKEDMVIVLPFNAFSRTRRLAATVSVKEASIPSGMELVTTRDATEEEDGLVVFSVDEGAVLGDSDALQGTVIMNFTVLNEEFPRLFTWRKILENLQVISRAAYFLVTNVDSGITVDSQGWQTRIPLMNNEARFLWYFEEAFFNDGTMRITPPHIIGIYRYESPMLGVWSVLTHYALGDSEFSVPVDGWSASLPPDDAVGLLWTRTTIIYTNGTSDTSYSVSRLFIAEDGRDGERGSSLVSMAEEFYQSTSRTEQVGGAWSEVQPEHVEGTYIWTRWRMTFINPDSVEFTDPVVNTTLEFLQQLSARVQSTEGDIKSVVQQVMDSDTGWRVSMARIGAYHGDDIPPIETSLLLNEQGVFVTSAGARGRKTEITAESFRGLFNRGLSDSEDETMFSIDEEEVYSSSLKVDREIKMQTMQLSPIDFGGNQGVAFVKRGGGANV